MNDFITYFAPWAVTGAMACVIIPRIRWKTQWKRQLFLFACGPFVWFVLFLTTVGVKFGIPIEYWRGSSTKRDDYLDGNTQADFDKVNTANADMQVEISELRLRLARLIKDVRRAKKGKVCVSSLKL